MKEVESLQAITKFFSELGNEKTRVFLAKGNRQKVVEFCTTLLKKQEYPVFINYEQSIKEMVAAGFYEWFDRRINSKNYSFSGKGCVEKKLKLECLDEDVCVKELFAYFKKNRLCKATIEEFLAFGATYLEMGLEFPIVCPSFLRVGNKLYMLILMKDDYKLVDNYNRQIKLLSREEITIKKPDWRFGKQCRFLISSK